jgi:CrcB protein
MLTVLMVGLGGFVGAVLRYGINLWAQGWTRGIFPVGTFLVNLIGCLFIGLLSQMVESQNFFKPEMRMFIFMGLLGALTTFSTFGMDTINLLQENRFLHALMNIAIHLVFGLGFVWLGRLLAGQLWE